MFKKSQTSTEYLIILAVVVVIALIVVGILGGIPSIGGGVSENAARTALATAPVGVTSYSVTDYSTKVTLRNNVGSTIQIDSVSINGEECLDFSSVILPIGQSRQITCENIYEPLSRRASFPIEIEYTHTQSGASFTQSARDLQLVGSVGQEYMSVITANQYWNSSSGLGCFDSGEDPIPLCTCFDLDEVRNHLSSDCCAK